MKYLLENPVVGTADPERYRARVRWRNGVLFTDEPEKLGGQDTGPDPYTLLLASLVSCTIATLRMYIDHKGLAIQDIAVESNMFYRLESDGPVVHIERQITIGGPHDAELRDRLIQVAESCPVSKMLKGTIKITTGFKGTDREIIDGEGELGGKAS